MLVPVGLPSTTLPPKGTVPLAAATVSVCEAVLAPDGLEARSVTV